MEISRMAKELVAKVNLEINPEIQNQMVQTFITNPKRIKSNVVDDATYIFKNANLPTQARENIITFVFTCDRDFHGQYYSLFNYFTTQEIELALTHICNQCDWAIGLVVNSLYTRKTYRVFNKKCYTLVQNAFSNPANRHTQLSQKEIQAFGLQA